MGRCALYAFVSITYEQQMAVRYACVEAYVVIAKFAVERVDELGGFGGGDVSCRVIFYLVVGDCQYVASHGHPAVGHIYAHACGFQHSSAFKGVVYIVAEHTHVGNLAAGVKSVGYGGEHA